MNGIYELRDRMEDGAIAGTSLLSENFRLKNAAKQLQPLAQASPVVKKLLTLTEDALNGSGETRPKALLDALALGEALAVTQAAIQVEGELKPLERLDSGEGFQIPYSSLAPLLEAFKGSGSGRFGVIQETMVNNPQLLRHFRLRSCLVQALGDSYSELANLVKRWLAAERDPAIIPLLKKNFNPQGKKDMARRIQVADEICGGEENDWYRQAAAEGSREVKEAAVTALRHKQENGSFLMDLLKTEKGSVNQAVLWTLSFMEGPETEGYWKYIEKKRPEEASEYLAESVGSKASQAMEKIIERELEELSLAGEKRKERRDRLKGLWLDARGKYTSRLLELYRFCAKEVPSLIPENFLLDSICRDPSPELRKLAEEKYEEDPESNIAPVFFLSLLHDSAQRVYSRFSPYLKPDRMLARLTKKGKNAVGLFEVLSRFSWDPGTKKYRMLWGYGYREEWKPPVQISYVMKENLAREWYPLLFNYSKRYSWKKGNRGYFGDFLPYDQMLIQLYCPDVPGLSQEYGQYFYKKALEQGVTEADVKMLKQWGWKEYKGLLATLKKKEKNINVWETAFVLRELPLEPKELGEELDRLIQSYGKEAVTGMGMLEKWRDELLQGVRPASLSL